ncbi:TPA: phage major capsid protein [Pseudomonas aeruginosa]|nr:phage major capsid protein [Pseudomonas aeruginosa]
MAEKKPPTTNSAEPMPVLRQIEGQQLQRVLAVDRDTLDLEQRTVEVAVSSEYGVRRWFGMEVLDHSADSIDLTRLRNGAPLLLQHNSWSGQIGVVEDAWLDADRKIRARVRFSRSEQAEPIWQDVVDNIRRNISCGYLVHEMVLERSENGLDHYRVTRWEPYEVSSVSVPADPTVGVGRSNDATTNTITIRGISMDPKDETNTDGQKRELPAVTTDPVLLERQRIADINILGERYNQRELAASAVSSGQSIDQFRAVLLERAMPGQPKPLAPKAPKDGERDLPGFVKDVSARGMGMTEKEMDQFSLMRALNAYAEKDWSKAGLEREVSLALADTLKKEARGFFVPHDLLVRGMSKGEAGKGGELVATELRVDQFIDILRNKTMMAKLGMRMLGGLVGDLDLPKKVNGSNFYWLGEGDNVTPSDFDLTTIALSPKTIAGAIPVTRKLRKQAAKSVEALIISDLVEGLGVAIDLAMLRGTGADNQPLGLLNQVGLPSVVYPAGGIDWASVVEMETKAATFNVEGSGLAYLTSPVQRGAAKKKQVFENTGERIWQGGEVNGYAAHATNQMPADDWLYGDFSQLVCGLWGVLDLKPDPYALAGSDGLMLRVFQDVDAAVRRKEAFCVGKKAAA